jgi:NAD-dependent deacetylase sirtuin 4
VEKMERKAGDVLRVFLDETLKYVLLLFLCRQYQKACTDNRTNSGPEVEAVKAALDLGVVKEPPEVEGPRAEG